MNPKLKTILDRDYRDDSSWQRKNEAAAERSKRTGDERGYFDLALHLRLPDTCWALERWDESSKWYRHNAGVLVARRKWHAQHSGPDYPHDQLLDREATTHIKAGKLADGRELLKK